MKKLFLLLCCAAVTCVAAAQEKSSEGVDEITAVFRFLPDNDLFMLLDDNGSELNRLYEFVDMYGEEIKHGLAPVYVTGYCASKSTTEENIESAKNRSSQVKSLLIIKKGLEENNFHTTNHASSYNGYQSAVIVEITVAARYVEPVAEPEPVIVVIEELVVEEPVEPVVVVMEEEIEMIEQPVTHNSDWQDAYCVAVRGNVLYWAGLLPSLGVEWRINQLVGVKLDGQFSDWTFDSGRRHNILMASPEVRFYIGKSRRFYVGAGGNFGKADMSWKPFSSFFTESNGYKGCFYGGGITAGYQIRLADMLSLDLNIGLGVTQFEYDIYEIRDGGRVTLLTDRSRCFWGPTQAGVTLVWRLGNGK